MLLFLAGAAAQLTSLGHDFCKSWTHQRSSPGHTLRCRASAPAACCQPCCSSAFLTHDWDLFRKKDCTVCNEDIQISILRQLLEHLLFLQISSREKETALSTLHHLSELICKQNDKGHCGGLHSPAHRHLLKALPLCFAIFAPLDACHIIQLSFAAEAKCSPHIQDLFSAALLPPSFHHLQPC